VGSSTGSISFGASTAPKGSLGNPVGFSFGSPPRPTPEADSHGTEASGGASIFSAASTSGQTLFGGFTGSAAGTAGISATEDATDSRDGTPLSETSETVVGDPDEEITPGEEEETTIQAVKCRISKRKPGTETGWVTLGVGQLRLKRHNDTGVSRLLHRDSNSRRITLNVSLFKGFKAKAQGKSLSVTVVEDGNMTSTYALRVPTEEDARTFQTRIEAEVDRL